MMMFRGSVMTGAASGAGVASGFRRNSALLLAVAVIASACDKVPLLAPTGSSISVTAPTTVLPVGGSTEITAFVMESSSTPVQNGTTVRFITNLGTVSPVETQTRNGVAITTFTGTTSGTASIRAVSGPAGAGTTTPPTTDPPTPSTGSSNVVTIAVGAAAVGTAGLSVRAVPATVPSTGGTVEVIATVLSTDGRLLSAVPVSFSASRGVLGSTLTATDERGEARTTLTTGETSTITARAGNATAATFEVTVRTGPSVTLVCGVTPTPAAPFCSNVSVGQLVTFVASRGTTTSSIVSSRLDFGDGQSVELGSLLGPVTVTHVYASTGDFTARLVATDTAGEQSTATQFVQVRGAAAGTVTLTLQQPSSSERRLRATATLNGVSSSEVLNYTFTFDGGTPATITTTSNTAEATYTTDGVKTVTVTVTLRDGRTATATAQFNVDI